MENCDKTNNKWYIISSPCQGKTTFVKTHNGKYGNYNLYDFDNLSPRDYRSLKKLPNKSIILGGDHDSNIDKNFDKSNYLIVKIPHGELLRNLKERQKKEKGKWAKKENVEHSYNQLNIISKKHNIEMYNSFESAIKYILNENK